MKKAACLFLCFLLFVTGCSAKTLSGNSNPQSQTATGSSVPLAPSSGVPDKTLQPTAFYKIDMITVDFGYAIAKDFHVWNTADGGAGWKELTSIPGAPDQYGKPALFALNSKTAWIAFDTANGIEVQKTTDSGKTWTKTELTLQTDDPNSGYGGDLAFCFISPTEGFLLTSTLPAAGQMGRALYKTSDGGANWTLANEKFDSVNGYTTGIGFSGKESGYITCTYHGQKEIPVYRTEDGGNHWAAVALPIPVKYASLSYEKDYYIDAYPPVFFGADHANAKMELNFCQSGKRTAFLYTSSDHGTTWSIKESSGLPMVDYCFTDDKTGFGLDESGTLFTTKDGGITWRSLS